MVVIVMETVISHHHITFQDLAIGMETAVSPSTLHLAMHVH